MTDPFLDRLKKGPIIADGGMGTYLYVKGASLHQCYDELNLVQPELVAMVHDEYITAGSDLIETNTFGANRLKLAKHDLQDKVREINIKGVKIARERREIAGRDIIVAGAVGPLGRMLGAIGGVSHNEARACFVEQIEALLEGGVDLFMVETISNVAELQLSVEVIRSLTTLPVVAQLSISDDLLTIHGNTPLEVLEMVKKVQPDVLGANCSVGPQRIYDFLSIIRQSSNIPLAAQPNAGLPRYHDGRFFFVSSPEYFKEYTLKFLNLGISIIGGCCGTTPEHIKAIRSAIDSFKENSGEDANIEIRELPVKRSETKPQAVISPFAAKLGKKFVVSVEIDPPKGSTPNKVLKAAEKLVAAGVDAINVADSPMARIRMSCLTVSGLIRQNVGAEIILHYTCRDRNLMGLQSDLLGAHALGISNILALTGDPPSLGDYPNATAVYDVDAIGLVEIISCLNSGVDLAGNSIGKPTQFSIGVAVNPTLDTLDEEILRLQKKIAAGAQFAMTQPLYELDVLNEFIKRIEHLQIPILMGLLPLQSYRHAEFLHNEVPGIEIPEKLRESLRKAGKDGAECGIKFCRELFSQAKDAVDGVYLMPSFGRYETILQVLD